jgi:hypothetical protein
MPTRLISRPTSRPIPRKVTDPDFDGQSAFAKAISLLVPYDLRLALNFEDPTNSFFSDAKMTAPVLGGTSSVGFMIDQAQGGLNNLGAELIEVPIAAKDWGLDAPTWQIIGGALVGDNTAAGAQTFAASAEILASGGWYVIEFDLDTITSAGGVRIDLRPAAGGVNSTTHETYTTPGTHRCLVHNYNNNTRVAFRMTSGASAGTCFISRVSVKQVLGNHAYQYTSGKRPTWGRFPRAAPRRNLLLNSEGMPITNDWINLASLGTVTYNAIAGPSGFPLAHKFSSTAGGAQTFRKQIQPNILHAGDLVMTASVYLKAAELSLVSVDVADRTATFDVTNGIVTFTGPTVTASIVDVGDGWYRCSVTSVGLGVNQAFIDIGAPSPPLAGQGFYATGAQVELGTLTDYQRVTNQYGGPRNLLTYSEDFSNAAWTRAAATFSGETLTATGAFGNMRQVLGSMTGLTLLTAQFRLKVGTFNFVEVGFANSTAYTNGGAVKFNLATGAFDSSRTFGAGYSIPSYSITAAPDEGADWWLCTVTMVVANQASHIVWLGVGDTGVNGNTILIRKAQTEVLALATNYQKVTNAFDVTESGVPSISGARFDGVDDCLQISAFDMSNTDKLSIITAMRRVSDAAYGIIVETNALQTNGSFFIGMPTLGRYEGGATGNAAFRFAGSASGRYSPPINNMVVLRNDISADQLRLMVDAGFASSETTTVTDQGTGNYVSGPLFIGQRQAATLPSNIWLTPWLFVCGDVVPDEVLAKLEVPVMKKIGTAL